MVLFVLTPFLIFAQTWRSTIDLNISVDYGDRIDLYTNVDGNHILLHEGSQIKYYLFSYNGSQVRSSTGVSSINENTRLAKLNGYQDTVYVSYKNGGYIYTKRSTNAGQSWSNRTSMHLNQAGSRTEEQ